MKLFRVVFTLFCGFFLVLSSPAFAKKGVDHLHNVLIFQVTETRLLLDRSAIEKATMSKGQEGKYSLTITLVPTEAAELTRVTQDSIGKPATVILNRRIINSSILQAPLSNPVTINGFGKSEAKDFVRYIGK